MELFRVEGFEFWVLPMRTRFPFRYGVARLTWLPHVVVRSTIVWRGQRHEGLASEGLPPKWFTKRAEESFEEELAQMVAVIQNAARLAKNAGARERGLGEWWRDLNEEQAAWAGLRQVPGLLAGLGSSLIERAVLDGLCRAWGGPLHELVKSPAWIPDWGVVRPELGQVPAAAFLPAMPARQIRVRHTVGLGDWLTDEEIPGEERLEDGLPQSLEASVRTYGLTHFKIKFSASTAEEEERLSRIFAVLDATAGPDWLCTLDGNEAFTDVEAFRQAFGRLQGDPALAAGLRRVLFVEQPLRRDCCLEPSVGALLRGWPEAPPLLLDEGEDDTVAWPRALELGYVGVSHKNCKGVLKGLGNAGLTHLANQRDGGRRFVSGEDLANVGPVALNQDLAVQALLGVPHVERNGHHYFAGLSMWDAGVREAVLSGHGDLYEEHPRGFPVAAIRSGRMTLESVNKAPFGCGLGTDWVDQLEPLDRWIRRGGMSNP